MEAYLAALARTDAIVVSRGLVLAHEAGLVDSGRWRRGRRTGNQLLRTGALRLNGCWKGRKGSEGDEKHCFENAVRRSPGQSSRSENDTRTSGLQNFTNVETFPVNHDCKT